MTFEEWWANLENKPIPQSLPHFVDCWNTAVEECARWISAPYADTDEARLMANAIKRTPIGGVMFKASQ